MIEKGEPFVFYGLTPRGYEQLSEGLADVVRWATEMKFQLGYYRGD